MYSFLIIHQKYKIKIYEYAEDEFKVLKNNGEEEQDYDNKSFWIWWKDKVNYQNEAVCFAILTDEDFSIPSDIIIGDKLSFEDKDLGKIIKSVPSNVKVIFYPNVSDGQVLNKTSNNDNKSIQIETEESPLNKYFESKTKAIKNQLD